MKTLFTVFNAEGILIDSPALELVDDTDLAVLQALLPSFRLADVGNGVSVRAKDYLKGMADLALLEMFNDALTHRRRATPEVVLDTFQTVFNSVNGQVIGEGDAALEITLHGDAETAIAQVRNQGSDALVFSLVTNHSTVLGDAARAREAIDLVFNALTTWHNTPREALPEVTPGQALPTDAVGLNNGVRLLTAADIQTMFSLTFPGFDIPELDKVMDHPANVVAEILATYGEADSASNALSRDITPVDPAKPVAPQLPAFNEADFLYHRDREELVSNYNVRFRGMVTDSANDPFDGTYMPHDVVLMDGALHYLNDNLKWVNFPFVGNGASWRIWLASVAGKRPVSGPGAAKEVTASPVGKPSLREELLKMANGAKANANTDASANPFYFLVKCGEVEEFRVIVRGVPRIPAVEQGVVTFLQRELGATTVHAVSGTFHLTRRLNAEQVIVATRTALQMLGLNAADIDVEPPYLALNEQYALLTA